jgi:hypothetical protein
MPNCSYSCSISTYKPVPDDGVSSRTSRSPRAAEQVGFDFLFPVAKWRGYGGPTNYLGTSLETTMTWAAGLLAPALHVTMHSASVVSEEEKGPREDRRDVRRDAHAFGREETGSALVVAR